MSLSRTSTPRSESRCAPRFSRFIVEIGVSTVYVTHDQIEAMTMGDRVAVLRGGVLQQFDTPKTLYERPRNIFVAAFIGSPAINLAFAER